MSDVTDPALDDRAEVSHQILRYPFSSPTMAFSCYACGYTSTRAAGLTNHKKSCQEHLRRVSSVGKTFIENDSKRRVEKRNLTSGPSQGFWKRLKTQQSSPLITVGGSDS
jgi:hypothetical protein